jgi:hypothetical protein
VLSWEIAALGVLVMCCEGDALLSGCLMALSREGPSEGMLVICVLKLDAGCPARAMSFSQLCSDLSISPALGRNKDIFYEKSGADL